MSERKNSISLVLLLLFAGFLIAKQLYEVATRPPPLARGAPAPSFRAPALDGTPVELPKGQIVLLDFWATWCPPCVQSMPTLSRVFEKYKDRGFVILGVNQEPGDPERVRRFVKDKKIPFPILFDQGDIARSYRVSVYPTWYLLDREGKVCFAYSGVANESHLSSLIGALLDTEEGSSGC